MALGAPELLILLLVVLVIFGGAKLPKLARSLGEAQREFKHVTDGDQTASSAVDHQQGATTSRER